MEVLKEISMQNIFHIVVYGSTENCFIEVIMIFIFSAGIFARIVS